MEKIRVGVVFGGTSREREVSFAGGRTVYDNLNKSLFEAVPLFVDSFGNIILLEWEYVYKGSIRDFYPPSHHIPSSSNGFQIYAESLGELDKSAQCDLIGKLGRVLNIAELQELIDIAFLCLHGSDGEDGRIQGMLEYLRIPYTGSGILSSAVGMNKSIQKTLMKDAGFDVPKYFSIDRVAWLNTENHAPCFREALDAVGVPYVVKAANQGSSIGISINDNNSFDQFYNSVNKTFFIRDIKRNDWELLSYDSKVDYVRELCDIREGVGLPVKISSRIIHHPEELLSIIIDLFTGGDDLIRVVGVEGESQVLLESFIAGKEFSCIVVEDMNGVPVALPPTEIRKGKELFDYRSKYLPGLSRKITPIQIDNDHINYIRTECERLFKSLNFNVYARIDGFITSNGKVFLNDPNTTSGMMPSSFFFHQAAEIGLNPSQFITYIIYASLKARISDFKSFDKLPMMLNDLKNSLTSSITGKSKKLRAAVILGGYSSERHISVESGRNVYEKLSSSDKYEPFPVFLTGSSDNHQLYTMPINALLKDNADDIKEKIDHYDVHPVVSDIIQKASTITNQFSSSKSLQKPQSITYSNLAEMADVVFIALHGRPGEDGSVQKELDKLNVPYNGSGPASSEVTIDKYQTNEILLKHGFHVAKHEVVSRANFELDEKEFYNSILNGFSFPFIAKPVDDGCSSAVKILRSKEDLKAFCHLIFRDVIELNEDAASQLKIKDKEEFPIKNNFLIESLITAEGAEHFLEITGGMLTYYNDKGELSYEVFEASEALSEGDVLSLEEKFLAGQGQNITPARYSMLPSENQKISNAVKKELGKAARLLKIEGYARIDAFVRIFNSDKIEVIFIEVNSLPGMTPATCIFHQAAIAKYKPLEFIDKILSYGIERKEKQSHTILK
jgi:D-alanine-D-alanine ligase